VVSFQEELARDSSRVPQRVTVYSAENVDKETGQFPGKKNGAASFMGYHFPGWMPPAPLSTGLSSEGSLNLTLDLTLL
jgi:hypothetical protein